MNRKMVFFIIVIVYRILLDLIYINITYTFNSYDGFVLQIGNFFFSWFLLIIEIILVSPFINKNKLSSYFIVIITFMKLIPFTSYIYCSSPPLMLIIQECIYSLLLLLLFNIFPTININFFKANDKIVLAFSMLFIATILFISGYYAHFRFHFSLDNVYELRQEARGYKMPTFLTYLFSNAVKVLPLLLIYYYEKKRLFISILIFIALLLGFGVDGLKSTFLNLFICLFLFIFKPKEVITKIPYIFVFICLFAYLEWAIIQTPFIQHVFIRRLLFIPSLLDKYYYEFVSSNGPTYFDNIINGTDVSFLVGGEWRSLETRANNGLFSDAIVNLGWLGIVLYPLFYVVFFKASDSVFKNKPKWMTFYAAFIMTYNMLSSFFTVCLFTHGMLSLLIVSAFLPTSINSNTNTKIKLNENSIYSRRFI